MVSFLLHATRATLAGVPQISMTCSDNNIRDTWFELPDPAYDLRDHTWHHVVAVVDLVNGTGGVYVDGVLASAQQTTCSGSRLSSELEHTHTPARAQATAAPCECARALERLEQGNAWGNQVASVMQR